ncbi:MAG TPA: glycosyltransferase family 1 protein [Gemmatimonadales bacterium]|nr:glycosyltransferase family 1 protein [Gemmatimonadales bacterium]
MNRVFINGRYLTQSITGVQRCAAETVRALDQLIVEGEYPADRWAFTLLLPRSAPQPTFQRIAARTVGHGVGQWWEQLELPLHARNGVLVSLANAAPIAAERQCVTIHDASVFAVPEAYRPAFRTWYRFMIPALGRRADRVLTVSQFSRDELVRRAGISAGKLAVVPNAGEHILAVQPDSGVFAKTGFGDRPYVLVVGSGSRHKNLQGIVRAQELVPRNDYDVVVVGQRDPRIFGGRGPLPSERIRPIGYVTDGELRALYEKAVCLLFPSLYEGFGLPTLEAMACGCPVIASNVASLPEICGDAALYCDPRDPGDIARRISQLLGQPELRHTLRSRALDRARGYRWRDTARGVMAQVMRIVPQREAVGAAG